jgi:hypothetical protein
MSVLALDLPAPGDGWSAFLAGRGIEVVTDDIGRKTISRGHATMLFGFSTSTLNLRFVRPNCSAVRMSRPKNLIDAGEPNYSQASRPIGSLATCPLPLECSRLPTTPVRADSLCCSTLCATRVCWSSTPPRRSG